MLNSTDLDSATLLKKMSTVRQQCTLAEQIFLSGKALFSGKDSKICLKPAPVGTGIVFKRVDLPGQPVIPASLSNVIPAARCTALGNELGMVKVVEHLLSAIRSCEIDNLIIEINCDEIPMFDGSAKIFTDALNSAEIEKQTASRTYYKLTQPVFWGKDEIFLVALPCEEYEFRISYTLHYPHCKFIGSQYHSLIINKENFEKEIASSRTFAMYEEILPMIESGKLCGGGLENGVVIKDNQVMNPEGLRFENEMVRHKILDLNGDLVLMGIYVSAHIIAVRSGHVSNVAFAKNLFKHIKAESCDNDQ